MGLLIFWPRVRMHQKTYIMGPYYQPPPKVTIIDRAIRYSDFFVRGPVDPFDFLDRRVGESNQANH